MDEDPFDQLLGLEDTYYAEGFKLGEEDGKREGLVEGRFFGLEKGFDKFTEMGRLHGRSVLWNSRLPRHEEGNVEKPTNADEEDRHVTFLPELSRTILINTGGEKPLPIPLKALAYNPRLEKHIRTLYALSEPESLSTQNKEEDVSDFDDRLKRAIAKAMIIGKLVGEDAGVTASKKNTGNPGAKAGTSENEPGIEDVNILQVRH